MTTGKERLAEIKNLADRLDNEIYTFADRSTSTPEERKELDDYLQKTLFHTLVFLTNNRD